MIKYFSIVILALWCVPGQCRKPNFVLILTDDQDVTLGGMKPMKNVKQLIARGGITFTNSFVTSPICCPSRASLLSGQYMHNHHTYNNSVDGGCYGHTWTKREKDTFPAALKKEGYNTFYAGKYLNQYGTNAGGGPERVPPGWSEWHGLVGNSVYYDYVISNNGVPTYSSTLYLTDVITQLGVSFIDNQSLERPFLAVLAPPAPHAPFTPARRHSGLFSNITAPRQPHFNYTAHDKHWLISMPPSPLPESLGPHLDHVYRSRWESMLAVDDMVAYVMKLLQEKDLLDNTYIIYTSDNGYHIGQFAQVYDKRQPYESDIRVPLIMRGPGLAKSVKSQQPVLNIDLAPTILKLAGIKIPCYMDGRPINFSDSELTERFMLIQHYGEFGSLSVSSECPWIYDGENLSQCIPDYACKCQDSKNNTFACIRHLAEGIDRKYCYFLDQDEFQEFYDLTTDQFELENIIESTLPAYRQWYYSIATLMMSCKGAQECDKPLGRLRPKHDPDTEVEEEDCYQP